MIPLITYSQFIVLLPSESIAGTDIPERESKKDQNQYHKDEVKHFRYSFIYLTVQIKQIQEAVVCVEGPSQRNLLGLCYCISKHIAKVAIRDITYYP
jgi:hypothetical protein